MINKTYDIDYHLNKIGIKNLDLVNEAHLINSAYHKNNRDIYVVMSSLYEANKLYDILTTINENVLFFPMDDFLTSEAIAISPEFKVIRINTLNKLALNHSPKIIVTHLMGALRYLPEPTTWQANILNLKTNQTITYQDLQEKLFNMGYIKETLVTNTGEIGIRGFVVDIFPIASKNPIRLEFFGDEIDSIREFDPDTQKSIKELDEVTIYPFTEFLVTKEYPLEEQKQKYLPKYSDKVASILDYLNDPIIVYNDYSQISAAYLNLQEEIFHYATDLNEKTSYMHDLNILNSTLEIYIMNIDNLSPVKFDKIYAFNTSPAPFYHGNYLELARDIDKFLNTGKTIIISIKSKQVLKNLEEVIDNLVITNSKTLIKNKVNVIMDYLDYGFIVDDYIILTEKELNDSQTVKKKNTTNYRFGTKIKDINKLSIGDYVVHASHGIGIYEGITTLTKNGIKKDYLQVKYNGNDKLYIPVEKIDLISKYSSKEGTTPRVNKLGGSDWSKIKQRVKAKVKDIASELLRIYARREAMEGFKYSKDTPDQLTFEQEFAYEATSDQLLAVSQIKKDMESKVPMDRLLCGDVGFGKTEVAFRAIFKAIMDGKQVAYLCPTTILSNQHYLNALERFKNYPINIGILNRFTTKKEQQRILEGLKKGTIDFVIGTHRLLSNDIYFKDLGLLVIDEEQRFGVTHKEKIKELKATVDVLTLSATPIPRTLQMSMSGLKHLSLIETAPVNRYPVQTYVMGENKQIIKDAIYKELSRNGQVFILYNKVESILKEVYKIEALVPDAKVTYAHGQMNKTELEDRMQDFIEHKYDVLVCTTIIETGIDIPNVNTLIIMDADRFGLSQLYQIRGRVGRTNKIAYAYLMYSPQKVLTETAVKRLQVIKDFTELGSGFSIAMRDLSIRGAGDILGSEQAGFIDTIGIELYMKILNDEVRKLKGLPVEEDDDDITNDMPLIDVDTHISDNYVSDTNLKIEIHKLINEIDSKEKLETVKKEIEDRFGLINEDIELYMYEEWFEKLAGKIGIEKVNNMRNCIELVLNKEMSANVDGEKLFIISNQISRMFRLSFMNSRLKIILDTVKLEKHYLYYLIELLSKISEENILRN